MRMQLAQKPFRWALMMTLLLAASAAFVLLDAFVVPKAQKATTEKIPAAVSSSSEDASATASRQEPFTASLPSFDTDETETEAAPLITATSYEDEKIRIAIETVREYDTTFYVAEIQLADVSLLKTAFAQDTFGRNIKEKTSAIAEANDAIFAVNGDYYGFRDTGYVLRNGVAYREVKRNAGNDEILVIDSAGDFSVTRESESDLSSLRDAWQVFSFGPALVKGGEVSVDESDEVGKSKSSNPRTAIGQLGNLHYLVVVSDGRTDESAGLSLAQLAEILAARGCSTAYNLDGGGSSTMVFQGEVVNQPTSDGRSIRERSVSDIVYIGSA